MERSDPAEPSETTTARHAFGWSAVALTIAVIAALLVVLLVDGPERAALPSSRASSSVVTKESDRSSATRALIGDLQRAWQRGDTASAGELADPAAGSRRELIALTDNIRRVELADLSLRYVTASGAELSAGDDAARTSVVDVQLTWRLRGLHSVASTLEIPVVVSWDGEAARFVSVLDDTGEQVPLWLQEDVEVRRADKALLVTTRDDAGVLAEQVVEARRTVRRTLPDWDGALVIEAPRTAAQFEAAAGMDAEAASAIAAVTTTTDGSPGADGVAQVYLNPDVFDPLGPEGRQIVLTHEATHVAVDALGESAPYWLSEGFADYVALADTDLPTTMLAAQILDLVREQGPPKALPGRLEFDGANDDIGAWYEAAWLATRLIADRYGEPALLDFYERAVESEETAAFREVLGTTKADFVRAWGQHLAELAR